MPTSFAIYSVKRQLLHKIPAEFVQLHFGNVLRKSGLFDMPNNKNAAFIADFESIEPVSCPCGLAQRALQDCQDFPGTIHVTEFKGDSKRHYHKRLTETYYVLSVQPGAAIEIDGQEIPLKSGMCIVIPPGLRHRGIGHFKILNVVIPKFDPADEWFD